jgi:hypothetical protein
MENSQNIQAATPENIWAILMETAKRQEETAKRQKETDRQMQETAKRQEETDRQMQETDRRMKELQKTVGGITNNQGAFAEEYFFNSFENGNQNFFGEKFDDISKQIKNREQGIEDEYDIVLYNQDSLAIIEVKYKAHINDIPAVLKKAETFRILFPNYKDYKIYLGLASMSFYPELEQECIEQGIAVIKQVGDTVVINYEHLKVF